MQNTKLDSKRRSYVYGLESETLVIRHIEGKIGHNVLASRYKTPYGEIDIIAEDSLNGRLIFIEVKARRGRKCDIESAISRRQIRRCEDAAKIFLAKNDKKYENHFCQFDLYIIMNGMIFQHIEGFF